MEATSRKNEAREWFARQLNVSPRDLQDTTRVPHGMQIVFAMQFSVVLTIDDIPNCTVKDILDQID